jgi:hypothetical protein
VPVTERRAGCDVHVEALVPVGVERLLDHARRARLLAIDRGHGEGIRETWKRMSGYSLVQHRGRTEHIALVQAVGGNDCTLLVGVWELCGRESRQTHW